jgi:flagellar biosynthetic protein FliQ
MMTVSAPILIVSLLVGLVISIFQAATSIQEYTLTFVPKIIAVAIITVLLLPWMMDIMMSFTLNIFNQMPLMAH